MEYVEDKLNIMRTVYHNRKDKYFLDLTSDER